MTAQHTLLQQHRECDELFALAETTARQQDWEGAESAFAAFRDDMERHFVLEEECLFPAFEQATGMRHGPTMVMRNEHAQMRELLHDMSRALDARTADVYLGHGGTLLILMQQHNMKEENILYPMCQQHVTGLDALISDWEARHEH
ncbi:hemerythrin domain-containing protein [Paludibacterium paludis]|uniref:Hemerythrin-like domain-containing protein n=1 Tax=Paludibacterium paludis TaxID=1225769 RepID=A0A918UBL8_9NEIS|nr:hemerythrin domain-containing protein [Paludibacterium paludis]GGY25254.1 hypothetical protein GCM10011289_31020 [Paludibacterium paludis]